MSISKLLRLQWLSAPSRYRPHGVLGAALLLLGYCMMCCAMRGSFTIFSSPVAITAFAVLGAANAIAGAQLAGRAPAFCRPVFLYAAGFQVCLCYYILRFSPAGSAEVASLGHGFLLPLLMLDWMGAIVMVGGIASFVVTATRLVPSRVIAAAILVGSGALGLLAAYPVQLAVGGQEWWTCIQDAYAMQAAGMVGCIYIPATTAFAAMLFGATLWLRKILSDVAFGGGFLGIILATLGGTVLMQEIWIPVVSTQKIYLPCPAPEPHTFRARVESALDFSALAQAVLRRFDLGIPV